jgi:hypothetical protein
MADQSDVETVLTALVSGVLYPQGTTGPSILGRVCRVYRGWPNAAALDADLAAGVVNVTVFPEARHQANTTRWPDECEVVSQVSPTLTVAVEGNTATFAGVAGPGQVAGLQADEMAVVHRIVAGDTPASVATVLASRLQTRRVAVVSGASVTVPGAGLLVGRVVADQTVRRATRRQRQGFRVSCWCPDPASRDAAASAIDTALSMQDFIALPDGMAGRLRFMASSVFDQSQDAALYRRDLLYSVDYATTVMTLLPSMIFGDATLAPDGGGIVLGRVG